MDLTLLIIPPSHPPDHSVLPLRKPDGLGQEEPTNASARLERLYSPFLRVNAVLAIACIGHALLSRTSSSAAAHPKTIASQASPDQAAGQAANRASLQLITLTLWGHLLQRPQPQPAL